MTAHVFLKNKTDNGELQEIEILDVDYIKMDEFYLSIYGTLNPDSKHEIMGNLIGIFLPCEIIGYYMEDL